MATMKAVVKTAPVKGAVAIEDCPRPTPGPDEVVVQVQATGICGTDRHIYHWDPSVQFMAPPVIFGHEFCGNIAALGSAVSGFAEGDYVAAEMHVVCNQCVQCRTGRGHLCSRTKILGLHDHGCFAEYVKVPASNLIRLPETLAPKVGGFLDALGNAVHTAMSADIAGKKVAIMGCGPIGAMAAAVVDFCGGGELFLTDVSDSSLERARKWAANRPETDRRAPVSVLDVRGEGRDAACETMLQSTGDGVDVVLEMSGAETAINDALRVVRPGGSVRLLGLTSKKDIQLNDYSKNLIFKGVDVQGIIGRKMYQTWYQMLDLLAGGLDVDGIVTAEYDLEQFQAGMDQFDRGEAWKVVLYPKGVEAAAGSGA